MNNRIDASETPQSNYLVDAGKMTCGGNQFLDSMAPAMKGPSVVSP